MEALFNRLDMSTASPSEQPSTMERKSSEEWVHLSQDESSEDSREPSSFELLPSEIIDHIISFLPPVSVAALLQTSHAIRSHAQNESRWRKFVLENLPSDSLITSPAPANSWFELYSAHYPYWFLTRHRFWFSDTPISGSIIVAEYDPRRGCIEAYRLLARHSNPFNVKAWEHDPSVHIHFFAPEVTMLLDDPVVKLDFDDRSGTRRLNTESRMQTGKTPGIASLISLCKPIQRQLLDRSMSLWPPDMIPTDQRVRNQSPNKFQSEGHRPRTDLEASDRNFRIRKYMQWSSMMHPVNSFRMGEDVMTFSAIPEELREPTKEKPYQGIWVGDYSAHGCEFLLVMQRASPRRAIVSRCSSTESLPAGSKIDYDWDDMIHANEDSVEQVDSESNNVNGTTTEESKAQENYTPFGRIEAIKLTGDVNVWRGQLTWFADDIGDGGLVRVVKEETFNGARIVKSMGHIASEGFQNDRYIESQLIMISPDVLAQYWEVSATLTFNQQWSN